MPIYKRDLESTGWFLNWNEFIQSVVKPEHSSPARENNTQLKMHRERCVYTEVSIQFTGAESSRSSRDQRGRPRAFSLSTFPQGHTKSGSQWATYTAVLQEPTWQVQQDFRMEKSFFPPPDYAQCLLSKLLPSSYLFLHKPKLWCDKETTSRKKSAMKKSRSTVQPGAAPIPGHCTAHCAGPGLR